MILSELVDAVVNETGRPDQETLIKRTVQAFILKAHEIDFFPRDRMEDNDVWLETQISDNITLDLPTRWRRFELIEPLSSEGVSLGVVFTRRSSDDLRDFSGCSIHNTYSVIGNTVNIRSATVIRKLRWVWYSYPAVILPLAESNASSWITDRYPQAIIDGASGSVLKKLGDSERSKMYLSEWQQWQLEIRNENLLEDI